MPPPTPIAFRCHSRIRHGIIEGFSVMISALLSLFYININLDDSSLAGTIIISMAVVCWSDAHGSDTCDCQWDGNEEFRLGGMGKF